MVLEEDGDVDKDPNVAFILGGGNESIESLIHKVKVAVENVFGVSQGAEGEEGQYVLQNLQKSTQGKCICDLLIVCELLHEILISLIVVDYTSKSMSELYQLVKSRDISVQTKAITEILSRWQQIKDGEDGKREEAIKEIKQENGLRTMMNLLTDNRNTSDVNVVKFLALVMKFFCVLGKEGLFSYFSYFSFFFFFFFYFLVFFLVTLSCFFLLFFSTTSSFFLYCCVAYDCF
jgi:hypothetical protein